MFNDGYARFMLRQPKVHNCFTLGEVISSINGGLTSIDEMTSGEYLKSCYNTNKDLGILPVALTKTNTLTIFTSAYPSYAWATSTASDKTKLTNLFERYIYPKYWKRFFVDVVGAIGETITLSETTKEIKKRVDDVISILNDTWLKYSIIIDNYESQKTNLMNAVQQTRELLHKYNDTPQTSGISDPFASDTHLTDASKDVESLQNDLATKMSRLDEIEKLWQDIYVRWSKEFDCLFIEGGEYDE